jgi:hypothetical protein
MNALSIDKLQMITQVQIVCYSLAKSASASSGQATLDPEKTTKSQIAYVMHTTRLLYLWSFTCKLSGGYIHLRACCHFYANLVVSQA